MSIKELRNYLAMCEVLKEEPTWENLRKYKNVLSRTK